MVHKKDRGFSVSSEVSGNIGAGNNKLVIEVALDLAGLNSPAEGERSRIIIGTDLYGIAGKLICLRSHSLVRKIVAFENYGVGHIIVSVGPNLAVFVCSGIFLFKRGVVVSPPESAADKVRLIVINDFDIDFVGKGIPTADLTVFGVVCALMDNCGGIAHKNSVFHIEIRRIPQPVIFLFCVKRIVEQDFCIRADGRNCNSGDHHQADENSNKFFHAHFSFAFILLRYDS